MSFMDGPLPNSLSAQQANNNHKSAIKNDTKLITIYYLNIKQRHYLNANNKYSGHMSAHLLHVYSQLLWTKTEGHSWVKFY